MAEPHRRALALLAVLVPCALASEAQLQRQLPSASAVFELGEAAQVKFDGAQRWVDCIIRGRSSSPETYDVHVPQVGDGDLLEQDFYGVPPVMLRRVYGGVEVNIEQHENQSSWVSALITGRGTGDTYNIELLDIMPGYAIDNVPPSLLREDEEKRLKAERLQQMIKENEAKKTELFYMARVKHNPKRAEALFQKAREDAEQRSMESAQDMAWKEMAKRAEQENAQRKFIQEWKEKRKNATRAKKQAEERKRQEKFKEFQEQFTKDDPVFALVSKVNKIGQVAGKMNMEFLEKTKKLAEQEKKAREERQERKDAVARQVQEQMEQLKQEHQAQLQAAATLKQEKLPQSIQARMKEFELVETGREKEHQAKVEEMERLGEEADIEYQAVEEARLASMAERRKSSARKSLRSTMDVEADRLTTGRLRSAVKEAEDAGVDASELNPARLRLVKLLTEKAREAVERAKGSHKLFDLQSALKDGTSKAAEIDRLWSSISDESMKQGVSHFEATELDEAKNLVPEVGKKEVLHVAVRARLELAKHGRSVDGLREAIEAAEAAGLPEDELDKARNALEDREVRPGAMNNLREAADSWDAARLTQAIQEGEAAGLPSWRLKGFKRTLAEWLSQMPQPPPPSMMQ